LLLLPNCFVCFRIGATLIDGVEVVKRKLKAVKPGVKAPLFVF